MIPVLIGIAVLVLLVSDAVLERRQMRRDIEKRDAYIEAHGGKWGDLFDGEGDNAG